MASEIRCTECGAAGVKETTSPITHKVGSRSVLIENDRHLACPDCGNISYRGAMLSENQLAIAEQIRRQEGLLTPSELHAIRAKYSLSQSEIEKILTIGPKTWVRWERGKVVQTSAADQMIRVIAKRPDVLRELMENAGVENTKATALLDAHDRDIEKRVLEVLQANIPSGSGPKGIDLERTAKAITEEARKVTAAG
jgi:putative zinc finger/helix-turn-helix YgiT family protein